jgi:hypothetical protein
MRRRLFWSIDPCRCQELLGVAIVSRGANPNQAGGRSVAEALVRISSRSLVEAIVPPLVPNRFDRPGAEALTRSAKPPTAMVCQRNLLGSERDRHVKRVHVA